MIVIPSISATYLLDELLDLLGTELCHLYTNAAVLGPTTTLANLTEATFPGYAPQACNWTPSLWTGSSAYTAADLLVWTRSMAGTTVNVFGYYITQKLGGKLLWAEARAAGPVPLTAIGDQVAVMPRIALREELTP